MFTTYLLVTFYGDKITFIEMKSSAVEGTIPVDMVVMDLHAHGLPRVLFVDKVERDGIGLRMTRLYTHRGN